MVVTEPSAVHRSFTIWQSARSTWDNFDRPDGGGLHLSGPRRPPLPSPPDAELVERPGLDGLVLTIYC